MQQLLNKEGKSKNGRISESGKIVKTFVRKLFDFTMLDDRKQDGKIE